MGYWAGWAAGWTVGLVWDFVGGKNGGGLVRQRLLLGCWSAPTLQTLWTGGPHHTVEKPRAQLEVRATVLILCKRKLIAEKVYDRISPTYASLSWAPNHSSRYSSLGESYRNETHRKEKKERKEKK